MQVGIREFLPLPLIQTELEAALKPGDGVPKAAPARMDNQAGTDHCGYRPQGRGGEHHGRHKPGAGPGRSGPGQVALIDLGRPFPDVATFLDQESSYSIVDLILNMATLDNAFLQRIMQPYGDRLSILHGAADFKDQDSIDLESLERIFAILRQMYEFIVIDLSHWLDELFLKVLTECGHGVDADRAYHP